MMMMCIMSCDELLEKIARSQHSTTHTLSILYVLCWLIFQGSDFLKVQFEPKIFLFTASSIMELERQQ